MKSSKTEWHGRGCRGGEGSPTKIVVFACNWCSPVSTDFETLKTNTIETHIIRLMCSGRFHPAFALKAFEKGADGVFIAGCPTGECHYQNGNERCQKLTELMMPIFSLLGIEPERVRVEWVGADEGERFAQLINEFSRKLKKLGPSPLRAK